MAPLQLRPRTLVPPEAHHARRRRLAARRRADVGCCAPKGATRKLSGYDNFLAKGPNSPSVANGVPSVISAMLYFDELPDDASITQLAQEFYSFDALSSRPQSGWWVPQPFNRDHHVHATQAEGETRACSPSPRRSCASR